MYYDKSNVKYFKTFQGRLICNLCDQSTTIDDSVSCKGVHLICNTCAYRIGCLLGITFGDVVIAIHKAGEALDTLNAHQVEREERT